jgi:arylsulfatase A-like enzyme
LAASGVLFSEARATASICRPSLMSLLTGLDPIQWDQELLAGHLTTPGYSETDLIRRLDTLPRLLQERGYASFQGGKFWYDSYESAGFSEGMTDSQQGDGSVPSGGPGLVLGVKTMQPVYDFIDAHAAEPFLLWFAPKIPHLPHEPPPEYERLYARPDLSRSAQLYYAMCSWLDALSGELLAHLEARGLREDTMVIFLTDNGWDQPPQVERRAWKLGSLLGGPLGKSSPYELGLRVPLVVSWPGRIEAGGVSQELVSFVDVMPTILDYVGLAVPEARPGHSLRPLIEGSREPLREEILVGMSEVRPKEGWPDSPTRNQIGMLAEDVYTLRTRDQAYVYYATRGVEELYDLASDPRQQRDLHAEQPARSAELRARVIEHRRRLTYPFLVEILDRAAQGLAQPGDGLRARCIRQNWSAARCLERARPR